VTGTPFSLQETKLAPSLEKQCEHSNTPPATEPEHCCQVEVENGDLDQEEASPKLLFKEGFGSFLRLS
jgi:hypothetical protein